MNAAKAKSALRVTEKPRRSNIPTSCSPPPPFMLLLLLLVDGSSLDSRCVMALSIRWTSSRLLPSMGYSPAQIRSERAGVHQVTGMIYPPRVPQLPPSPPSLPIARYVVTQLTPPVTCRLARVTMAGRPPPPKNRVANPPVTCRLARVTMAGRPYTSTCSWMYALPEAYSSATLVEVTAAGLTGHSRVA